MWYRRTFTVPRSLARRAAAAALRRRRLAGHGVRQRHGRSRRTPGGYDASPPTSRTRSRAAARRSSSVGVYDPTDAGGQAARQAAAQPGAGSSTRRLRHLADGVDGAGRRRARRPPRHDAGRGRGRPSRLTVHATGDRQTVVATARDGAPDGGQVSGPVGPRAAAPRSPPALWSPDDPFLYDLQSSSSSPAAAAVDEVRSYFGMRSISRRKNVGRQDADAAQRQVRLPDRHARPGLLAGRHLHRADRRRAQVRHRGSTRTLGFNMVRKHIKVEPDRWYYWADKLGLLVWQDMPAMPTGRTPPRRRAQTQFETSCTRIVDQHRSAPVDHHLGAVQRGLGPVRARRGSPTRSSRGTPAGWSTTAAASTAATRRRTAATATSSTTTSTSARARRRRAAHARPCDGEYGGLGLPVAGHMWRRRRLRYEIEPDAATLTSRLRRPCSAACGSWRLRVRRVRGHLHPDHRRRGRAQRPLHLRPARAQAGRQARSGPPTAR